MQLRNLMKRSLEDFISNNDNNIKDNNHIIVDHYQTQYDLNQITSFLYLTNESPTKNK